MRGNEIKMNEQYAVKTHPHAIPYRGEQPRILRATAIGSGTAKTMVRVEAQTTPAGEIAAFTTWVPNVSVIASWTDHHERVAREQAERAARLQVEQERWERERRERRDRVERFAEAYRGIKVQPFSTANFPQDDVDLGEELLRAFGDGAVGAAVHPDVFEAVAKRIFELSEIVRQNALVAVPTPEEDR